MIRWCWYGDGSGAPVTVGMLQCEGGGDPLKVETKEIKIRR
jgi:hypothetical protein